MSAPLLEFIGIEKAFFGVKVLKGITFNLSPGSAVGLVGENGAGKSTLMNILGGNVRPDAGRMRLASEFYSPAVPKDAELRGIAFIHQELNLFPNLTVAENIFLTRFPRAKRAPFINQSAIRQRASDLLLQVGLQISPDTLVEKLSAGERQLVEISKALALDARLIIFDEPTTSLGASEVERLFALIASLRARGIAMIYISHTLEHVFRICEQIVTLRDGEVVANGAAKDFTHSKLVSLMVGRDIDQLFPTRQTPAPAQPILEVRSLSRQKAFRDISFNLHRGEVLGLAGLMGAGRSELARAIFGLDPISSGQIFLHGKPVKPNPRASIRHQIAFLTENRGNEGLCLNASVAENLTLLTLDKHSSQPFFRLNKKSLTAAVTRIREVVRIDPKVSDSQPVRSLSGGNQQKIVLGKWLLNEPEILILDEPTRGIDVGAKFEIYQLIKTLSHRGAAVLLISSELEELIGLCDRILTLRRGQIAAESKRDEFNRERILEAALGTAISET